MYVLQGLGLDVRIITRPSGKDPDELLASDGGREALQHAEIAPPVVERRVVRGVGRRGRMQGRAGAVAGVDQPLFFQNVKILLIDLGTARLPQHFPVKLQPEPGEIVQ